MNNIEEPKNKGSIDSNKVTKDKESKIRVIRGSLVGIAFSCMKI